MPDMKLAIVEDEAGAAELMRQHLLSIFDDSIIHIATNLTDAWNLIYQKGPFDIIFLDLNLMPHSPADNTIKQIPQLLQHCNQIVVISGLDSNRYETEIINRGALGYMSKAESLLTRKSFLEKLVEIYRKCRGRTNIEANLERLEQIVARNPPQPTNG